MRFRVNLRTRATAGLRPNNLQIGGVRKAKAVDDCTFPWVSVLEFLVPPVNRQPLRHQESRQCSLALRN
jgi:hypothetical protein